MGWLDTLPVDGVSRPFPLEKDGHDGASIAFHRGLVPDRLVFWTSEASPLVRSFYSQFYEHESDALAPLRRYQIRKIAALAGLSAGRGQTFLDVGAGSGVAIAYLHEVFGLSIGLRSYGVEPALPVSSGNMFRCKLSEVQGLAGLPERFDFISFLDVLEHFEDPSEALAHTREILDSAGRIIVKVPTGDRPSIRPRRPYGTLCPPSRAACCAVSTRSSTRRHTIFTSTSGR